MSERTIELIARAVVLFTLGWIAGVLINRLLAPLW